MPAVVDDKGSVVASPTTGKTFSRSSGGGVVDKVIDKALNQLAEDLQQTPQEKKESKEQARNQVIERQKVPSLQSPGQTNGLAPLVSQEAPMQPSSLLDDSEQGQDDESYWDAFQRFLSENIGNDALEHNKDDNDPGLMPAIDKSHIAGEGDVNRWGETYREDPVGPVSQAYTGSTRNNDRYEDMFSAAGMSDEDLWDMSHKKLNEYEYHPNSASPQDLKGVYNASVPVGDRTVVDDGTLDYTHLTSPKILGSRLQEYARNGMAPGLTADDIEKIYPDKVYDKAELAADPDVQFIPYLPNDNVLFATAAEGADNLVSKATGEMANLRGNISEWTGNPYMMRYDNGSQSYEINGPEFDRTAYGYVENLINDMDNNPNRFFLPHDGEEQSWTQYAQRYQTTNPDGDIEYHYGMPVSDWVENGDRTWNVELDDGSVITVDESYFPRDEEGMYLPEGAVRATSNNDGTWSQEYTDGSTAVVTDEYLDSMYDDDGNLKVPPEKVDVTGMGLDTNRLNGGVTPTGFTDDDGRRWNAVQAAASSWVPNYVMDDGTVLTFDDVLTLATDTNGRRENKNLQDGQSIEYDFNNLIPFLPDPGSSVRMMLNPLTALSNRPVRLSNTQPLSIDEETGELEDWDWRNFVGNPWERIFDLTAGSLPIMLPMKYSMPISATGGIQSLYGANNYDPVTNTYSYIPDNTSGATAQVLTPINEQMVGPVGEGVITPLSWLLKGKTGWLPAIGRGVLGAGEEGLEEILGNFFDEYGEQGLPRTFGPYLDENGNEVDREYQAATDEYGRPIRQAWDPDGDIFDQLMDRAYYSGLLPYHDGKIGYQQDALVNNINSFYGGSLMSLPGSLIGSGLDELGRREQLADDLAKLEGMGITGTYNVPSQPRTRRVAPEEYLEQWRTMPSE